ncbi:monovalent cation/H(+) antiporter subunit G [Pseudohongiella sp. SYSU M77423]|uniref:cation:proton antiporter n=1 Tax=unclassified Pseudohongiella TaxID=2629611 RepID=UPI001F003031|nr:MULTISPECIES: monovalent cation/H(+) antiporter subunit G [unclassified Pseudohongiella]MDH7942821.1 monovalent cation/H(+) antiporter subunit G [Pseudohongiella sp. SYSU M77423]
MTPGTLVDILSWTLMAAGICFYLTGALGLLRFSDFYCRLHAVTKTDTLGLGFLALGLAIASGSLHTACYIFLIYLIAMASAAVNGQLLARYKLEQEQSKDDS